jgi:hypothetical protein
LDTGFDAHALIDPLIVGDVTGDGTLSGQDAASVAQNAIGIPQPQIPDDPDPGSAFTQNTGPQRIVNIQSGQYAGSPGALVEVPVEIDDAESLLGVDLEIGFDTAQLRFDSVRLENASGEFMEDWTVFANPDEQLGLTRIAIFGNTLHEPGSGDLVHLLFEVEPTAPAGTSVLDVEGELNEGGLEIVPVDGDITVTDGDFNNDGQFDCADIDALVVEIAGGGNDPLFDLTGDNVVDLLDRDTWLSIAGAVNLPSGNPYLLGDANLSGVVDFLDFNIWAANRFTTNASWCSGDFDASGVIDFLDFNIWATFRFQSSLGSTPPPTPEETSDELSTEQPAAIFNANRRGMPSVRLSTWQQDELATQRRHLQHCRLELNNTIDAIWADVASCSPW